MRDRQLEPESGFNFTRTPDDTVSSPLLPRQDEIRGRQQGESTEAPITPEIGVIGCDFDDIHGARAVDILEIHDLTTRLNNTPRHDDLIDKIRRLEAENRALLVAKAEDTREAVESAHIIAALQQRLEAERDNRHWKRIFDEAPADRVVGPFSPESRSHGKPSRASVGEVIFGKDSMPEWNLSPATRESDLSNTETT